MRMDTVEVYDVTPTVEVCSSMSSVEDRIDVKRRASEESNTVCVVGDLFRSVAAMMESHKHNMGRNKYEYPAMMFVPSTMSEP